VFWSVHYIAVEIELPFGDDPNDLPLEDIHKKFNENLMMLLQPHAQHVPELVAEPIIWDSFTSSATADRFVPIRSIRSMLAPMSTSAKSAQEPVTPRSRAGLPSPLGAMSAQLDNPLRSKDSAQRSPPTRGFVGMLKGGADLRALEGVEEVAPTGTEEEDEKAEKARHACQVDEHTGQVATHSAATAESSTEIARVRPSEVGHQPQGDVDELGDEQSMGQDPTRASWLSGEPLPLNPSAVEPFSTPPPRFMSVAI